MKCEECEIEFEDGYGKLNVQWEDVEEKWVFCSWQCLAKWIDKLH